MRESVEKRIAPNYRQVVVDDALKGELRPLESFRGKEVRTIRAHWRDLSVLRPKRLRQSIWNGTFRTKAERSDNWVRHAVLCLSSAIAWKGLRVDGS